MPLVFCFYPFLIVLKGQIVLFIWNCKLLGALPGRMKKISRDHCSHLNNESKLDHLQNHRFVLNLSGT